MKYGSGSRRALSLGAVVRALAMSVALIVGGFSMSAVLRVAQAAPAPGLVTVTVVAADKTYTGFADASVEITSSNFAPTDDVFLFYTGTATFSDRNVGVGKTVTVTGVALGGADAGKYTLASTTAFGSASITQANLTISAVPDSRVYNGTTSSTGVPTVSGLVAADTVTGLTQTFDSKNVGINKTLSVSSYTVNDGNSGLNYAVLSGQDLSGVITARTLTISAVSDTKPYDGTNASAATPSVSGLVGVDTVTGLSQTYDTKFVGTGKTMTVAPGFSVNDDFAGTDYNVTVQTVGTGVITPVSLTITGAAAASKAYDGTATASVSGGTLAGALPAETVAIGVYTAHFNNKSVGVAKPVTVTGVTLTGADAANYAVSPLPSGLSADITTRTLSIAGAVAANKAYDGTITASVSGGSLVGAVPGDTVGVGVYTAVFADPSIGLAKSVTVTAVTLTGADASNYSLPVLPTGLTANITPRPITITGAVAANKAYDGTATASVSGGTLVGVVSGETVAIGAYTAAFNNKNAGVAKPVTVTGVTLTGADAGNYIVSPMPSGLTADITGISLTITGAVASNKAYDGTVTVSVTGGSLVGVAPGDVVTISSYTAVFNNRNIGTAKPVTVTSVTLAGANAGNYSVSPMPSGLNANITAKPLTITGAVAANKAYDGTITASVSGGSLVGVVSGDTVAIGVYTAAFADPNAGIGKPVTVLSVTLTGADAGNYVVSPLPTGLSANISGTQLTITGAVASNKVYDGTVAASVSGGSLVGVAPGDVVAIGSYTAAFNNRNVGAAKTVTVTGVTLTGANAGNYTVSPMPSGLSADITQKPLSITAATDSKTYDGDTSSSASPLVSGLVSGDTVAGYAQTFDTRDVGTGKTLTVTGYTVNDGNSGNNYAASTFTNVTGVISARGVTVTANNAIKNQGDTLTFTGTEFTHSPMVSGDGITAIAISSTGASSGAGVGDYPIVGHGSASGTGLANYSITYVDGILTVVAVTQPGSGGSGTVQGVGVGGVLSIAPGDLPSSVTSVTFTGASFTIVPAPGFTGFIHLPITITLNGVSSVVFADFTVAPADPAPATYFSPTSSTTLVRWTASPGAVSYVILVNSIQVGTAPAGATTFTVPRAIGGSEIVQVQALGNGNTSSNLVMARWLGVPNRLIATIRFAANSSWLTATAMSKLRAAARWVRTNHVTKLTVTGFTEKHAHGSIVFRKYLSLQRARRARTYLLAQFAKIHIRVTIVAVGSGGAGKNLVSYRRVEVVANGFAPVPK